MTKLSEQFDVLSNTLRLLPEELMRLKYFIQEINEPIDIFKAKIQVGVSIGIATHPDDGNTVTQLMKSADTAMYASKKAGKNTFRFYNPQNITVENS